MNRNRFLHISDLITNTIGGLLGYIWAETDISGWNQQLVIPARIKQVRLGNRKQILL